MEVKWCPQESGSGVCSFAAWHNEDLQNAIRKAFNTSPREELVAIEIDRHGIKAFFEPLNRVTGTK